MTSSEHQILVVDPDPKISQLIESALQTDFSVRTVNSAQDAIHACDLHRPELVLLELNIADQNGIALLHELRSHSDWQDLPVIVHTAVAKNESGLSQRAWTRLGVERYLYKPTTNLAELRRQIGEVIGS